jgi:hypothetical protein
MALALPHSQRGGEAVGLRAAGRVAMENSGRGGDCGDAEGVHSYFIEVLVARAAPRRSEGARPTVDVLALGRGSGTLRMARGEEQRM